MKLFPSDSDELVISITVDSAKAGDIAKDEDGTITIALPRPEYRRFPALLQTSVGNPSGALLLGLPPPNAATSHTEWEQTEQPKLLEAVTTAISAAKHSSASLLHIQGGASCIDSLLPRTVSTCSVLNAVSVSATLLCSAQSSAYPAIAFSEFIS